MLRLFGDIAAWLLSKATALLLPTVAVILTTIGVRHYRQQEQWLREKREAAQKLERVRAGVREEDTRVAAAAGAERAAEENVKRTAGAAEAIRSRLAAQNARLRASLQEVEQARTLVRNRYEEQLQAAARCNRQAALLRPALAYVKRLEGEEPWLADPRHVTWAVEYKAAVSAYKAAENSLGAANAAFQSLRIARDAADRFVKEREGRVPELSPDDEKQLRHAEQEAANARAQRESTMKQTADLRTRRDALRKDEQHLESSIADLTLRVAWYEAARREANEAFQESQSYIVLGAAVVLGARTAGKFLWFYALAPLAGFARPLRLAPDHPECLVRAHEDRQVLDAPLSATAPLLTRADWVAAWPVETERETRLLWKWRAPGISYLSGLRELTSLRLPTEKASGSVTLRSARDPFLHVFRLDLVKHPGFIIKPGYVVAVHGEIEVRTKWCIGSLHAWVSGSLRRIVFHGTGTLYLCGCGGVNAKQINEPTRIEENLVIGFDGRNAFRNGRTETFWHFWRGQTSLFDFHFSGPGLVICQNGRPADQRAGVGPLKRAWEAILGISGKILGF